MPPEVVRSPEELRHVVQSAHARAGNTLSAPRAKVGFVPTMGALHDGHLSLVRALPVDVSLRIVSIFVNPTQFGPQEDLAKYTRDLDGDLKKLETVGVDLVFAPNAEAIYPAGDATRVAVSGLSAHFCGPFRPGHFEGVATVLAKLFSIVQPDVAAFGRKDFQQLAVIRRLTQDLFFPIDIIGVATARDADGLARSSRNTYLSTEARRSATAIPQGLGHAWDLFTQGERSANVLRAAARAHIEAVAESIDYVEIAPPSTLVPYGDEPVADRAVLAVACRINGTRLIDNVVLGEDPSPLLSTIETL